MNNEGIFTENNDATQCNAIIPYYRSTLRFIWNDFCPSMKSVGCHGTHG